MSAIKTCSATLVWLVAATACQAVPIHSISGNFLDVTPNPAVSTPTFDLLGGKPVHTTPVDPVFAAATTGNLHVDLNGPGWTNTLDGATGTAQIGNIDVVLGASHAIFKVAPNAALVEHAIPTPLGFLGFTFVTGNVTLLSADPPLAAELSNFTNGGKLVLQFSGILLLQNGPNSGQAVIGPLSVAGNYTIAANAIPEPTGALLATSGVAAIGLLAAGRARRASRRQMLARG